MKIKKPLQGNVAAAKENKAEKKKTNPPAKRTMMTRNMKKRENMEKVSAHDENVDATDGNTSKN